MSTSDNPVSANKVILYFRNTWNDETITPVKNIYINTSVPDMFQFDNDKKISGKMDCRKQYEQQKFDRVYVSYGDLGIHIEAFLNETNNDRQELFIPERYVICVGVDYESEQH